MIWSRHALTAVVATGSGGLAWLLDLPLPWMLGALFGTAAMSLGGLRLTVPSRLRLAARASIGLILGASLEPETLGRVTQWPLSLLAMFVGMVAVMALSALYYTRIAGFDRLTATAASLTGGLSNILSVAIQMGANPPGAVIGQLFRLTAVVVLVPMIYTIWLGSPTALPAPPSDATLIGRHLWIATLAWPALVAARWLRLPVPDMLGPLLLAAAFAVAGMPLVLPPWLVAGVFVVIGAGIGARFHGLSGRVLMGIGGHSLVATLIVLLGSAALAFPVSLAAGVPVHVALLAVAPGGVAEMAILATILGVDPVFVTFHQAFRSIVLNSAAPFVLARVRRGMR